MQAWSISIFVMLFTFQSIAAVIETEGQGSHDQLHHLSEGERFVLDHVVTAQPDHHDQGDHEGHHVHLCHHHHGEHNPQGLFTAPSLFIQYSPIELSLWPAGFYVSQLNGPLLRPPIYILSC